MDSGATLSRIRITSYNVCYTKLLRFPFFLSCYRAQDGRACEIGNGYTKKKKSFVYFLIIWGLVLLFKGFGDEIEVENREKVGTLELLVQSGLAAYRITSYNVCYTKLLRFPFFHLLLRL